MGIPQHFYNFHSRTIRKSARGIIFQRLWACENSLDRVLYLRPHKYCQQLCPDFWRLGGPGAGRGWRSAGQCLGDYRPNDLLGGPACPD